jgi:hypothetical protein
MTTRLATPPWAKDYGDRSLPRRVVSDSDNLAYDGGFITIEIA